MNCDKYYYRVIDLSGLRCPIPVLRLKKELNTEKSGSIIKVFTTDPATLKDFEIFCNKTGDIIIKSFKESDKFVFIIRKKDKL
ncbi:MAG: Sulfurtransferase TusA [Alphaproteobacteria bacterium MarineAlpha2_Bin1]|nr:MAG: Sulfurtransferase TusA [Alphaproteobacteria bacterium MarineAlpha2_Bin1]|tara:strand:- start:859 stop:1107 length:249 start_codon:yes stop_codon:yes gene_type:complete